MSGIRRGPAVTADLLLSLAAVAGVLALGGVSLKSTAGDALAAWGLTAAVAFLAGAAWLARRAIRLPIVGGAVAGGLVVGVPIVRHIDDFGWFYDPGIGFMILISGALVLLLLPWIAARVGRHRRLDGLTPWQLLMAEGEDRAADRVGLRRRAAASLAALAFATWPLGWETPDNDFAPPIAVAIAFWAVVLVLLFAAMPYVARELADRQRITELHQRALDRQTVGAHLHDSVLQTLALIQRTDDPVQVKALARRQERDLRRWLAGREEQAGELLAPSLRAVAADVEDEYAHRGPEVEVITVGDRALDDRVAAVVWAAREAMRNAVRHGGGLAHVYAEVRPDAVLVWVRDEGEGFDPAEVPSARRGVRDAIVGRMQHAGGLATITRRPEGGTEVQLVLPIDAAAEGGAA